MQLTEPETSTMIQFDLTQWSTALITVYSRLTNCGEKVTYDRGADNINYCDQ